MKRNGDKTNTGNDRNSPAKRLRKDQIIEEISRDDKESSSNAALAKFEAGRITEVKLNNFMNHQTLSITDFNPYVNIITGVNGAGKSSFLQGMMLGLGGKARNIKRHSSMAKYIKEGLTKAEITVTLSNQNSRGEESYKPETYGSTITFHRTIRKTGFTNLELKNDQGMVVYSGKGAHDEAERILSNFNIYLDNPLTVLHQEEAKQFFMRDNLDASLFEFVMASTFIKDIQEEYVAARIQMDAASAIVKDKQRVVANEEADLARCIKTFEDFSKFCDDEAIGNQVQLEKIKWGYALECKEKYAKAQEKLATFEEKKENMLNQKIEYKILKGRLDKQLEDLQSASSQIKEKLTGKEESVHKLKADLTSYIDEKTTLEGRKKHMQVSITQHKQKAKDLSTKVKQASCSNGFGIDEKQNYSTSEHDEHLKKQQELQEWNESKRGSLISETEEMNAKLSELDKQEDQLRRGLRSQEREKTRLEKLIKDHKSQRITGYSQRIRQVTQKIQQNLDLFQNRNKPPIGPVGQFITLKGDAANNNKLAILLEVELNTATLKGFLCDNRKDRIQLEAIMRPIYQNGNERMPRIFTKSFRQERYNQVKERQDYPSVHSYLNISNPDVFNLLVDEKNIDSVLVLDTQTAQSILTDIRRVPLNVSHAITTEFYRYNPVTRTQNYASYHMNFSKENLQRYMPLLVVNESDKIKHFLEAIANESINIEKSNESLKIIENQRREHQNRTTWINEENEKINKDISQIVKEVTTLKTKFRQAEEDRSSAKDWETLLEQCNLQVSQQQDEIGLITLSLNELHQTIQKQDKKIRILQSEINVEMKKCPELEVSQIQRNEITAKRELESIFNLLKAEEVNAKVWKGESEAAKEQWDKAEKAALKISNGKRINVDVNSQEYKAMLEERERKRKEFMAKQNVEQLNSGFSIQGMTLDELTVKKETKEKNLRELKINIGRLEADLAGLNEMRKKRSKFFVAMRSSAMRTLNNIFEQSLEDCNLFGQFKMNYPKKEISILVGPANANGNMPDSPLSNMSGGERSKTLLCFVNSLWQFQYSPFRCLDEWDVFVDDYTRPILEEMVINNIMDKKFQCFLISPRQSTLRNKDNSIINEQRYKDKLTYITVQKS